MKLYKKAKNADDFYNLAKYKFTYDEPDDFDDAFDYAYNIISQNKPKYECLKNVNALYGKISSPLQSVENINYYGMVNSDYDINFNDFKECNANSISSIESFNI